MIERITIARVKQVSKYLEIWTGPHRGSWDYAIRNGWVDDVLWDDDHYDEITTHGMKGLVVDIEVGKHGHTKLLRIVGRDTTMSRIPENPRVNKIEISDEHLDVRIASTDVWVRAPLSPRLIEATPAQRERYEFVGSGIGIHWPDIDEDLSVSGLIRDTTRWWRLATCANCHGKGSLIRGQMDQYESECSQCHGRGAISTEP